MKSVEIKTSAEVALKITLLVLYAEFHLSSSAQNGEGEKGLELWLSFLSLP